MRRRILLILLLLVAGAIVNVAVAWGIALMVNPVVDSRWTTARRYEAGIRGWSVNKYAKTGVERYWSSYEERSDVLVLGTPDQNIEELVPTWGNLNDPNGKFEFREVIGYGWPAIAMWAELKFITMDDDRALRGAFHWHRDDWVGQDTAEWAWKGIVTRVPAVLPIIQARPGFAINTIFCAAIIWMMFAFPFMMRRRRRIKRGLCPACAYPVGQSEVCTECGKAAVPSGHGSKAQ